jgi:hypothetical protein
MAGAAARWWKIYPLPAHNRGHISNVSAVVLPGHSVGQEDAQLPMFTADELAQWWQTTGDLVELARLELQIIREQRGLFQERLAMGDQATPKPRRQSGPRGPVNHAWRTWRGFVLDLQRLQAILDSRDIKVTKQALSVIGVDSVKTITRAMVAYGLRADQWPPSTWDPNERREWRAG